MRRSLAIGGSLTRADIERLIDACASLLAERARISAVLAELPQSVTALRSVLNELHRIIER